MGALTRLAVFNSRDLPKCEIVPPPGLDTLVLVDQFLSPNGYPGSVIDQLQSLTKLRTLVLTNGANNIERDRHGSEICALLPNIETFRWHCYYFEGHERILHEFLCNELFPTYRVETHNWRIREWNDVPFTAHSETDNCPHPLERW